MNRTLKGIPAVLVVLLLLLSGTLQADSKRVDWKQFCKGLNSALNSNVLGLQKSAMRLVIKYGCDNLNLKKSLTSVIEVYENAPDAETKELALLTIYQIDRKKATKLVLSDLELETTKMREIIEKLRATR